MSNDEYNEQCGRSGKCDPRDDGQDVVADQLCGDAGEACAQGSELSVGNAQEEGAAGRSDRDDNAERVAPRESGSPRESEPGGGLTPDVSALLAEAEQRGYLRGRNERIDELMSEPGLWQRDVRGAVDAGESEVLFLNNRRQSIWDVK